MLSAYPLLGLVISADLSDDIVCVGWRVCRQVEDVWVTGRWIARMSKSKRGSRAFIDQAERCVNAEHVSADNALDFTLS